MHWTLSTSCSLISGDFRAIFHCKPRHPHFRVVFSEAIMRTRLLPALAFFFIPSLVLGQASQDQTTQPSDLQPAPAFNPSQGMKADPLTYISSKIGIWTKEDAELELGPPQDRGGSDFDNALTGDLYKYNAPYSGFGIIELNISRSTKKLTAAYFYYRAVVSWERVKKTLGKNYTKQKQPNGRPAYLYQFGNRRVSVSVDSENNVFNVGVW
jgi:hypothetical protein